MWSITAYGISEITAPVGEVNVSKVIHLFNYVGISDLKRPVGDIDLLVGSDWCPIMPEVQQTVDRLQLMRNLFGFCL